MRSEGVVLAELWACCEPEGLRTSDFPFTASYWIQNFPPCQPWQPSHTFPSAVTHPFLRHEDPWVFGKKAVIGDQTHKFIPCLRSTAPYNGIPLAEFCGVWIRPLERKKDCHPFFWEGSVCLFWGEFLAVHFPLKSSGSYLCRVGGLRWDLIHGCSFYCSIKKTNMREFSRFHPIHNNFWKVNLLQLLYNFS